MTPDRAAAVHATEVEIAERFTAYGIPEPTDKAQGLIRWMQRKGWRVHPVLADRPPLRPPTRSENGPQHLAEARAVVNAKRGNRPEREATP